MLVKDELITFVIGSITPRAGGLYMSVRLLAQELARQGSRIEVVSSRENDSFKYITQWEKHGVKVSLLYSPFGAKVGYLHGLSALIRKNQSSVVHIHGFWGLYLYQVLLSGCILSRKLKVVISPRGMLDAWAINQRVLLKKFFLIFIRKVLHNRITLFHCLAEDEVHSTKALFPSVKCVQIPNAVNIGEFSSCGVVSDQSVKSVVFLSRLHSKKNVLNLIDAWANSKLNNDHGWSLDIYGWGDASYVDKVRHRISTLPVRNIYYGGAVFDENKDFVLDRAAVFILPSSSEGMPMAVLEAASRGTCLIISDGCNLRELYAFENVKRTGISVKEITESLDNLLQMNQFHNKSLRDFVRDRFSWSSVGMAIRESYTNGREIAKR